MSSSTVPVESGLFGSFDYGARPGRIAVHTTGTVVIRYSTVPVDSFTPGWKLGPLFESIISHDRIADAIGVDLPAHRGTDPVR